MRFIVEERETPLGPLFQVIDTNDDREIGFSTICREDADRRAERWERLFSGKPILVSE